MVVPRSRPGVAIHSYNCAGAFSVLHNCFDFCSGRFYLPVDVKVHAGNDNFDFVIHYFRDNYIFIRELSNYYGIILLVMTTAALRLPSP
jgi:hypothetical protein